MNGFGGRTFILKLHENKIIVTFFLDSDASITVDASSLQGFDELSEEDFNVFHEGFMVGLGLGPVSVHMDPCPAEEEGEVKEFTELKPPSFISQFPSLATLKATSSSPRKETLLFSYQIFCCRRTWLRVRYFFRKP